ncbi:potassium channel family protein, partial [Streptomyces avermitilis]|uniref:potassium channel family protein n=1 Tax=Streptomyces avermitilis TaxID=33903 RepID=UPI0033F996FA
FRTSEVRMIKRSRSGSLFIRRPWPSFHPLPRPNTFSESLSRTDALYFAMTVFSTVGFGDITPRSEPARLLTTGQMTVNLLLIGVAARFLVNAVQEGRRQRDRSTTGGQNDATPNPR